MSGLTVPAKDSFISLIVGGWGGGVCGISNIDGNDAARNETTSMHKFEKNRWYHVRLRVLNEKIEAWVDDDQIVDVTTKGRQLALRGEVEPSRPFGITTYQTTGALKNIRVRTLTAKEVAEDEAEK